MAPLDEELKKLGLRVRPRPAPQSRKSPGQIAFDDRGNAVYEWTDALLSVDGEDGERARSQALEHPGLSLVDEEPQQGVPIRSNPKGLRVGYNPYESGLLAKKEWKKRRDLRELSKWIELQRRVDKSETGEE